ncbi:MAG TPA: DNA topoisomerase I, partial [Solirubrobacterales bacterium]|nr:DNA topoisomerase I [Solirubrobacterales bacterium]
SFGVRLWSLAECPCYPRRPMRLIVTEKNNSAEKIATFLSKGGATSDKTFKVPYYTWTDDAGETHRTIGLKGHVLGPAFPEGYSNWQKTDLHDLIDAELIKEPTDKNVVKAIRKVAKEADELVIATDFDREGELIGLEALEEMLDANPELGSREGTADGTLRIKRARYSALTKEEIDRAFDELDELSYPLANAGAARQDIDLLWGATLTRAVSLASRRFGSNFLSVGRVQSPTLGLIVEREMERRAHVPKPFWEVFAKFQHPDGSFEAHHSVDKFWEKAEADAALAGTSNPGTVKSVTARRNTRKPPTPYNTTAFSTDASSRLGITPASAMRIAEDLYMDGFISYPRTDNTVYPSSLPVRELVSSLTRIKEFSAASGLLEGELKPTRGKKETTDHPPIYPTQAVHPGALEGPKKRVYELVVRRFLATFSPPMITESTRADIEAGDQTYFVRGSVVVDPGYAAIYTYARSADEEIPKLEEGQTLQLEGEPWQVGKETQPPGRISQAKLIEMMEERGLGTKATRADIIQKLFDRGYVYANPPIPTETGIALYEAFKNYVPAMATPEMTATLEAEMDRIAAGEMSKGAVVGESRDLLHKTWTEIDSSREDLAKVIWKGMDEDRILGPCKVCEEAGRTKEDGSPNMLRIIRAKKSGKRFVGCSGWTADDPNSCDQTFPLPQRGDVFRLEERCSICDRTPRLKVQPFRGRPWNLCLNDDCESMQEMKKRRAEREAAKAAKAAMEKKAPPKGDEDAAPATETKKTKVKASKADTATRGRKRAKAGAKS